MQNKGNISKLLPYLAALLFFIVLSYSYFTPLLEGKRLDQHDQKTFRGGAKEIIDYREETGKEALWTNRMFTGMPSYLISTKYKGNIHQHINKLLQIGPRPGSYLFLLLLGSYFLLLALRVNPWLSIVGAIAFAFSSYNFIIMLAGHNTKVVAIAYVAPVLAGIFLTFKGKRLLGAALTGIFLSLQLLAGHPQITYYTLIIVLIFGLSELYFSIKGKTIKEFGISVGLLAVVVLFSVLSNYSRLATTMEYDKYSMRSKSELTEDENDQTEGLTLSYATQWSYGVDETLTLLIPGFKGGSNDVELSKNSNTYEALADLDRNLAGRYIEHVNLYWGSQMSTSGPVYLGAIIIFLFILGMFLVDKRYKWWIFAATVLGIMLSWGKNFMPLTEFFMNNIPAYNKFRTVSMTLVIPQITVPILAILALNTVLFGEVDKKKLLHALKWSLGIAGGLSLLFVLIPSFAGDFSSNYDMQVVNSMSGDNVQVRQMLSDALIPALEADRMSMVRSDAFRSLAFILLSGGLIWLVKIREQKINVKYVLAIFGLLIIADMWPVNKRFLNDDNFTTKKKTEVPYTPSQADNMILSSPGLNNRVLNLTVSPFQDASTSYFHQSLGGYHGAKMRRYQDLINTRLMDEISIFIQAIQSQDMPTVDSAMRALNVMNMLNTRFIITHPNNPPLANRHAMGNAWFVNHYTLAENADDELAQVSSINIRKATVLDKKFGSFVEGKSFVSSLGQITLMDYQPNKLSYRSTNVSEGLAVFSEIFYDKGWIATIDGKETEHFRVNYLLRGLVVPEGEHDIIFEFKPDSYYKGEKISLAGSLILILLLIGSLYYEWREKKRSIPA